MRLAKWEDRGYYAQRVAVEKAQRQLHRLSRRALQELREPAGGGAAGARWGEAGRPLTELRAHAVLCHHLCGWTHSPGSLMPALYLAAATGCNTHPPCPAAVLTAAARSMGFEDLAAPGLDLPDVGQHAAAAPPLAAASSRKAKKAAKEAAAAAAAADSALLGEGAAAAAAEAFGATCAAALGGLEGLERAGPSASVAAGVLGGKYTGQLPRLTRRFQGVVEGDSSSRAVSAPAAGALGACCWAPRDT